jgi:hypothetical protein
MSRIFRKSNPKPTLGFNFQKIGFLDVWGLKDESSRHMLKLDARTKNRKNSKSQLAPGKWPAPGVLCEYVFT